MFVSISWMQQQQQQQQNFYKLWKLLKLFIFFFFQNLKSWIQKIEENKTEPTCSSISKLQKC